MKKYLLLICFTLVISGSAPAQFGRQWVKTFNDPTYQGNVPAAITLNSAGCVIVTGTAYDSIKKINQIQTIKYDPSGNVLWQVKYAPSSTCTPSDITTDAKGNIFITANVVDTSLKFYPQKIHALKYNCSGKLVWDAVYPKPQTPPDFFEVSTRIAVDVGGNIFVGATAQCTQCYGAAGFFLEPTIIKFDSNGHYITEMRTGRIWAGNIPTSLDALNDMELVGNSIIYSISNIVQDSLPSGRNLSAEDFGVEKYDTSGKRKFFKRIPRPSKEDFPVALFVGKNENIYITGWTADSVQNATHSYLTVKLDSAGNIFYVKERGNTAWNSEGISVAADELGDAYIAGKTFKNGPVSEIELFKYDPNGNEVWAKTFSSTFKNYIIGRIHIDAQANIYINASSIDSTNSDCLLLKYDSSGSLIGEYRTNGPTNQNDYAEGMVVNTAGEIFITGNSQSANGTDYLTAKYGFPTTAIGDSLCLTAGVSELRNADNAFSIYPDPANQSVSISWPQSEGKKVELGIFNVLGKEVMNSKAQGPEFNIDVRNLVDGVYFIQLKSETMTVKQKFVVKH